ncbi:MAG: hypothetical protein Q8K78_15325 [Planctomycetaceae bacterium]|jgi:hypothetical protein|nr:hypothetical protein [Planctomycetaceae bacterium]
MTPVGSPAEWADLLDSLVPEILALVIATWEEMPPPASDAREDPLSTAFCQRLRAGRNRFDLPFDIWTQLVELDPAAGEDQGRMDIVFKPMVPREYIYFCLECKRLNVKTADGVRPYASEYVRFGMLRFVKGQYAQGVCNGGMLAYVLDGDVRASIANVEGNIKSRLSELGMDAPGAFLASAILPSDERIRETRHRRLNTREQFIIHHLFMQSDSRSVDRTASVLTVPTNGGTKRRQKKARK